MPFSWENVYWIVTPDDPARGFSNKSGLLDRSALNSRVLQDLNESPLVRHSRYGFAIKGEICMENKCNSITSKKIYFRTDLFDLKCQSDQLMQIAIQLDK